MAVSLHAQLRAVTIVYGFCSGCITASSSTSVTGESAPTNAALQSETAASISFSDSILRIIVTYNDTTNEAHLISYTPTDRLVQAGASLMGWSYSEDEGEHWTYGGKVSPPPGWAVLWGDPAITTVGAITLSNVVFISNLAVPSSKFPPGGIHGDFYYGTGRSSYIGGACIARSTDGGRTFAAYQCVSNTTPVADVPDATQGHFYDGGSMASNDRGEVFAAFRDVATDLIDVYQSPGPDGKFTLLPTPFPGWHAISHPRLRVGRDGSLYVAAQLKSLDGEMVYMNRFANGVWGTQRLASDPSAVYPDIDLGTIVQGSELTLRTGPQFSFDVGVASAGGRDAVRMLYTRRDAGGHLYLDASTCYADLSSCFRVPGWRTDVLTTFEGRPAEFFNPNVVAWKSPVGSTWQASFEYHIGMQSSVGVAEATLGYFRGTAQMFANDLLRHMPVCSDTRGYWGDYDAMIVAGVAGERLRFMRFSTDSSRGCTTRWKYVAVTQHVRQSSYIY